MEDAQDFLLFMGLAADDGVETAHVLSNSSFSWGGLKDVIFVEVSTNCLLQPLRFVSFSSVSSKDSSCTNTAN